MHCKYIMASHFTIYMYLLFSVTSFHGNIFVKLSGFYICTLQTLRKVLSLILIHLYLLWEICAILKKQKDRLLILSIGEKNIWNICYTVTTTKIFITFSIEGKVCIITVEIQQSVVTIESLFFEP